MLAAGVVETQARQDRSLANGWRFFKGEEAGAAQAVFPDRESLEISLPHCWGWDEAQVSKDYYRGPGWYRRGLDLQRKQGKRYFLRFEAAGSVADVFLNGDKLGQHRGAFSAFCHEITDALGPVGKNVLAVRVSNAPEPDIAPLAGDFCMFGGLYRPVHLLVTDEVCFTPVDHASPGVTWLQSAVSDEEAVIDVTAYVSNGGKAPAQRTLTVKLCDAKGRVVAQEAREVHVEPGITPPYRLQLKVTKPRLWRGRDDPYLYKAVAELTHKNEVLDAIEQRLGLRSFHVDPDKGFFLNGKPYPIRGVCRHQDVWNKGWALTRADHKRDLALILEMGANTVRCAHYQHSDEFYSLCDEAGVLVWAEIPLVLFITPSPAFAETTRGQLIDLIRQNVNHSSIFVWGLFNELQPTTADTHRLLQDLQIVAHGEDPTRPTIGAQDSNVWGGGKVVPRPTDPELFLKRPKQAKIPDLLGWNLYPGWYFGSAEDAGPMFDQVRHTSRSGGICISEYGAGANPFQHEENCRQPQDTTGQWHPEEWQNVVHEKALAAIQERPFIWGSFIWNMFDFVSAGRNEGGVMCRNDKGLVTSDRSLKKDAFYFYKANWSDQPVLYITSRRFTERSGNATDVKVYSNAEQVGLAVNGKQIGKPARAGDRVFVWKDVPLSSGANRFTTTARFAGREFSDECVWTAP
jgi:beta-galactosidase